MQIEDCDPRVIGLVESYLEKLGLPNEHLAVTSSRVVFSRWLGRSIPFRIGGAYSMHPKTKQNRVFVHLDRLDLAVPFAIEVVVAEELIHMRDHLRGDFRRHSHHGHDRIAWEVERISGFTPEQQRSIFGRRTVRLFQYLYECPKCRMMIPRRRRGTWSCRQCSGRFNRDLILREVPLQSASIEARAYVDELNRKLLQAE
ncbi:MAG: hypothetical protein WKF81_07305 [Thermomicrobiales bacterium]